MIAVVTVGKEVWAVGWGIGVGLGIGFFVWVISYSLGVVGRLLDRP